VAFYGSRPCLGQGHVDIVDWTDRVSLKHFPGMAERIKQQGAARGQGVGVAQGCRRCSHVWPGGTRGSHAAPPPRLLANTLEAICKQPAAPPEHRTPPPRCSPHTRCDPRPRAHGPAPPGARSELSKAYVSRALSEGEVDLSDAMLARVGALAEAAAARGVRLMVDAEHTYFQPVRRGGRRKQRIG
jgi:hypothetical protein